MLESETYIGGKVEAIESGVFRSDLPMKFKCKQTAYQVLPRKDNLAITRPLNSLYLPTLNSLNSFVRCLSYPQALIDKLDADLHYAIVHEGKMRVEDITNYDEVKAAILVKLEALRDVPNR